MALAQQVKSGRRPAATAAGGRPLPALGPGSTRQLWVAVALLFVATFALYVPTLWNDFIPSYDDKHYVTDNDVVKGGLSPDSVVWAFTTTTFANWLPITWLSHLLDVSLFGLNPGGHHATSAAIHAANAALVLLCLVRLTGRFGPSLAAATLFAAHPLRVESVAWVAERKDVLAALFFLLALLAYARYAGRPGVGRYLVVAACHALGLMSKTMLVTLPCVLLLLDWWPLGRWRHDPADRRASVRAAARLALEKVPLLALSAVASGWTMVLLVEGGASGFGVTLTRAQRVANAVVSVPRYLWKTLVPTDLSIVYPHPGDWPAWQVAGAGALILGATVACYAARRRAPYLAAGWLWFVGMLVPVLGFVKVGYVAMTDRYTYIPGIGLAVAVCWAAADLAQRWAAGPRLAAGATAVVAAALAVATVRQELVWRDTYTLFAHAAEATDRNWMAENQAGTAQFDRGEVGPAIARFKRASAYYPAWGNPHHNLAVALESRGEFDAAAAEYREAIRLDPKFQMPLIGLGSLLLKQNRPAEAVAPLSAAAAMTPDNPDTQALLSRALVGAGRTAEAAQRLRQAPGTVSADVQVDLGVTLMNAGKAVEAADAFRAAIRLEPANAKTRYQLGVALAAQGNFASAATEYAEATRLQPAWVEARVRLAHAYGQLNRFDDAEREAAEVVRQDPRNATATRMLDVLRARPGRQVPGTPR